MATRGILSRHFIGKYKKPFFGNSGGQHHASGFSVAQGISCSNIWLEGRLIFLAWSIFMNHRKLTVKMEKFVRAYIETGNASKGYRFAYNAEKMASSTITRKACELLKNGNIRAMIRVLKENHAEKHEITVESLTIEYQNAFKMARANKNPSAMVQATTALGKLHGFFVERQMHSTEPIDAKFTLEFVRPAPRKEDDLEIGMIVLPKRLPNN